MQGHDRCQDPNQQQIAQEVNPQAVAIAGNRFVRMQRDQASKAAAHKESAFAAIVKVKQVIGVLVADLEAAAGERNLLQVVDGGGKLLLEVAAASLGHGPETLISQQQQGGLAAIATADSVHNFFAEGQLLGESGGYATKDDAKKFLDSVRGDSAQCAGVVE